MREKRKSARGNGLPSPISNPEIFNRMQTDDPQKPYQKPKKAPTKPKKYGYIYVKKLVLVHPTRLVSDMYDHKESQLYAAHPDTNRLMNVAQVTGYLRHVANEKLGLLPEQVADLVKVLDQAIAKVPDHDEKVEQFVSWANLRAYNEKNKE